MSCMSYRVQEIHSVALLRLTQNTAFHALRVQTKYSEALVWIEQLHYVGTIGRMNWKGFGTKWVWPNRGPTSVFI